MSADRARLRELLAAATPGPWRSADFGHAGDQEPSSIVIHAGQFDWKAINNGDAVAFMPAWDREEQANADLITAAVNALPALLDALDRVEALADEAKARQAAYPKHPHFEAWRMYEADLRAALGEMDDSAERGQR